MYNPHNINHLANVLEQNGVGHDVDTHFKLRLASILNQVREKFHFLYGHRPDTDQAMDALVNVLVQAYSSRSKDLRKTDELRMQDPHWFASEKITGMMLYVDRFAGDLKKLDKKIDYFDELGINLIHLMPLLKSPEKNNDGGYAVSDYRTIDPKYGTMADLKKFAGDLHKRDMLLMFDLVVNHTSDEHEWAKLAKWGDPKYQGYYYMYNDRTVPDQFEKSLPEVFPESSPGNFTFDNASGKWVMTVFHHYQWDLNYTNPWVFIEMVDIMMNLLNHGVDVIRLDALAFLWKKIGTTSQNLDEAHVVIQLFKACCQIVAPGAIVLAEAIVAPVEIVRYFGSTDVVSNECDVAYNATLMTLLWDSIATKNNRLLNVSLHSIPKKPDGTTWLNYVRCHDDIGLGYEDEHARAAGYDGYGHRKFLTEFLIGQYDWSFASGLPFMVDPKTGLARISGSLASLAGLEKSMANNDHDQIALAVARIKMLHSVIISYGGIPLLYAGDEIGTTNDYSFLKEPDKAYDNRWVHRPIMDWKRAEKRHEYGTLEQEVFSAIQKMIKVRKGSPEFADRNNCQLIDAGNQHILAYLRFDQYHKTLVVCNLNDHAEPLYMNTLIGLGFDLRKGVTDKFSGKEIAFSDYQFVLQPYQFCWITQNV